MPSRDQMTVRKLAAMKAAGRKIVMLTAYDYAMAELLDETGIDGVLVGDSLGMVVQGHANTLPVTLDQMIYHAEMVGRAVRHALVLVDMPFLTFQLGTTRAIRAAGRVACWLPAMKEWSRIFFAWPRALEGACPWAPLLPPGIS